MFRVTAGATCLLVISAGMSALTAATPSIGVAISNGNIRINEATSAGNANVYDGTLLETDRTAEVRMTGGAQLQFGVSSTAKLYSDHIDLQRGSARTSGLSVNANGLRISPDANGSARVALTGKVVQIAALTGNVRIFNADGMTVANLLPGRALSLTPQDAGAAAPSSLIGCAQKSGDVVTLTDETSSVIVQLRGGNVRAGRRVQVTGSMVSNATPAGRATQVIAVTSVKNLGGTCKLMAGATAAGAAGATAGAAAAGVGAAAAGVGATTAVVAGVAVAAAAATGGVLASGALASSPLPSTNGAGSCVGVSPCTF
jgi:hypothetical protein